MENIKLTHLQHYLLLVVLFLVKSSATSGIYTTFFNYSFVPDKLLIINKQKNTIDFRAIGQITNFLIPTFSSFFLFPGWNGKFSAPYLSVKFQESKLFVQLNWLKGNRDSLWTIFSWNQYLCDCPESRNLLYQVHYTQIMSLFFHSWKFYQVF